MVIFIISTIIILLTTLIIGQIVWSKYHGQSVEVPTIPREQQILGQGPALKYAILGDSTAVTQGGDYERGYATASAAYLAKNHRVTWQNFAISGARSTDVLNIQIPKAVGFAPDVALIAVGANDVVHITKLSTVRSSLLQSVSALRAANPQVKIVLTGSPDMGSVTRFTPMLKWAAGKRTEQVNKVVAQLAREQKVIFAPIAAITGPLFRKHPELFAADQFHPNSEGYETWTPVIIDALVSALQT